MHASPSSAPARFWRRSALALCWLCACEQHVDKPTPPDMTALIEAYADPSAELSADTMPEVREALGNLVTWLLPLCGFGSDTLTQDCADSDSCLFLCHGLDPLQQVLGAAADQQDEDARRLSRIIRNISGYFDLVRTCPGQGERPTLSPDNGDLTLQIGFTSRGIDPVFGGTVDACEVPVGGVATTLAGKVALAFDGPFFLDQLGRKEPIIRFQGDLKTPLGTLDDVDANLQLSATGGSSIAFSLELPDGRNVVFRNGTRGPSLSAQNGEFSCRFPNERIEDMFCVHNETGERVP